MQVLSEEKRERILSVASELFATHPFHKVLLSDVARIASVSKGTLYTYFNDKEHLYVSAIYEGFFQLLDRLKERLETDHEEPYESIKLIIRELIGYFHQNPHFFELMRTSRIEILKKPEWSRKREELYELIQSIIEKGITLGRFNDPHPELTAMFIPGLVRSAVLNSANNISSQTLYDHIIWFIEAGLIKS